MNRYFLLAIFVLTVPAVAQDLGIFEEVSAGNIYGLGARQMAMGGTGIASPMDGAALFYNPAALARIPRIEFQLGLTHQNFSNTTSMTARRNRLTTFSSAINKGSANQTNTRLASLNLAVPVPTYRGSLVVAFGINRVISFDRAAFYHIRDVRESDDAMVDIRAREHETGGINLYSGGIGWDLSPNVSAGASLNVYYGEDKYVYEYEWIDDTIPDAGAFYLQFEDSYFGVSAKGGLLIRPNNDLAVGITVESPVYWEIDQKSIDEYGSDVVTYNLVHPFTLGLGTAVSRGRWRVAGEAEYVDWSQMSYSGNPSMEFYNDSVAVLYRGIFNLRFGLEYLFPGPGLSLRAGAFSQPLPYDGSFIKDDRRGYTFGFGWLIDRVLLLEAAYVRGGFTRQYTAPDAYYPSAADNLASAEDRFQRLFFTISYRY